jgi:hypothetical protein
VGVKKAAAVGSGRAVAVMVGVAGVVTCIVVGVRLFIGAAEALVVDVSRAEPIALSEVSIVAVEKETCSPVTAASSALGVCEETVIATPEAVIFPGIAGAVRCSIDASGRAVSVVSGVVPALLRVDIVAGAAAVEVCCSVGDTTLGSFGSAKSVAVAVVPVDAICESCCSVASDADVLTGVLMAVGGSFGDSESDTVVDNGVAVTSLADVVTDAVVAAGSCVSGSGSAIMVGIEVAVMYSGTVVMEILATSGCPVGVEYAVAAVDEEAEAVGDS